MQTALIPTEFVGVAGGRTEADRLVLIQVGHSAIWRVNIPEAGQYRALASIYGTPDQGEVYFQLHVGERTRSDPTGAYTGSDLWADAYFRERVGRWHLVEMTGRYFKLPAGEQTVTVTLLGQETENATLQLGEIYFASYNYGQTLGDRLEISPHIAREMSRWIRSYASSPWPDLPYMSKVRAVKRHQPFQHLQLCLLLSEFWEREITGRAASERTWRLVKQIIDKDMVPNGFNELVLTVFEGGPRTDWWAVPGQFVLGYPTRLSQQFPFVRGLISEEEDCIRQIVDYCREVGLRSVMYVNGCVDAVIPKEYAQRAGEFELANCREVIERYHPDGIAIEFPHDRGLIKDIKGLSSRTECHIYVVELPGAEEMTLNPWIYWSMSNIRNRKAVRGPNEWLYPLYEPVDTPLSFRELVIRALACETMTGLAIFFGSPYCDVSAYCHVMGAVLREARMIEPDA